MLKKLCAHLFCQPHMERRIPVLLISVIMMGFCVAVFDQIAFAGTDPCTVFNLAFSQNVLGWDTLGTCQLLFNLTLFFIIMAVKEGRRIGLGSLANMVLVGYAKDFFDGVLNAVHPLHNAPLTESIIVFIPTMILFLIVVAFYMCVDLGVAPYDAIPQIIAGRCKKVSFPVVRMCFDLLVTLTGFLLGGTVGVVTLVVCFFIGPIIQMIANKFRPWFN